MGLARSFKDGIDYALAHGADIVVNTDGDNQYPQERISDLVAPIVDGLADIVIADRQTATVAHFSPLKRRVQRIGSAVVSRAAETRLQGDRRDEEDPPVVGAGGGVVVTASSR